MKKSTKNILIIFAIIILIGCNYITYKFAVNSFSSNLISNGVIDSSVKNGKLPQRMPPDMNDDVGRNDSSDVKENTAPEKPSNNIEQSDDSTNNRGRKHDSDTSSDNQKNLPEKPSNNTNNTENKDNSTNHENRQHHSNRSNDNQENLPEKPNDNEFNHDIMNHQNFMDNSVNNGLSIWYYCLFGVINLFIACFIIYLVLSHLNQKNIKETFISRDKIIIFILSSIILMSLLTFADNYLVYQSNNSTRINPKVTNVTNTVATNASASTIIDGKITTLSDNYSTSEVDESVILVKNKGSLTLSDATIRKSGGDSSNTENSEFYGINAGVLVTENSTSTIKNTSIETNAKGSNAVFATGENAKIYISDSTISTLGSSSARGLDATYGGYIEADNVTIKTKGNSCATLATDRGEGTIIAKKSDFETNGAGSPVIYSTGDISIDNSKGIANGSQMVVIEGKNSALITNSTLSASGDGNRNNVDQAGIMIYQSMSGDASEGTGTFTAKDSSLSIQSDSDYYKTAPMFFVTNTTAVINLENTELNYGSNILLSIKGTTEWGTNGSNGGDVTFNASNQTLKGDITIDDISTLTLSLKKSSYHGTINGNNAAKNIKLVLDKDSSITLTGDTYVSELVDSNTDYSNINFNGYKLYVNGNAIN